VNVFIGTSKSISRVLY